LGDPVLFEDQKPVVQSLTTAELARSKHKRSSKVEALHGFLRKNRQEKDALTGVKKKKFQCLLRGSMLRISTPTDKWNTPRGGPSKFSGKIGGGKV